MCITIPPIEGIFDEVNYQVPVYAAGNNSYNMDPVRARALQSLADEFAAEDPDLHKHFLEKGIVARVNIGSVPSEFMVTDVYDIKQVEDFNDVQRSSNF